MPGAGDVLISADPGYRNEALLEIRDALAPGAPVTWLEEGLALASTAGGFDAFAAALDAAAPVFVRHVAPVAIRLPLTGTPADVAALAAAAHAFAPSLSAGAAFSVQTRILGEGPKPYRRVTINETVSTALAAATGAVMNAREPESVVTIVALPDAALLGISRAAQNRSAWPGGQHRFRDEEGQISRAEHKLLEALSLFPIAPQSGEALDLGAAPGGWTRVLRARGYAVTAVDPAELAPALRTDAGVTHIRRGVEAFNPGSRRFALVVNDLRMDPIDSIAVMRRAQGWLSAGGAGVITLKLPEDGGAAAVQLAAVRGLLDRLAADWRITGARHLWHNRHEVTVVLAAGPRQTGAAPGR